MNALHLASRQASGPARRRAGHTAPWPTHLPALLATLVLAGCATPSAAPPPPRAARPGALLQCEALARQFQHPHTQLSSATLVPEGSLLNAGQPVGAHCLVSGQMHRRVSAVDGQTYAIGFELRLPRAWSGRFLYQGNGGTDGVVVPAEGGSAIGSGGVLHSALQRGFAVISSDAGHSAAQNPLFGLDPQARLDYGYQAVAKLTPMAKALLAAAYGRGPDRSYIAGTSNGGRHAMVAAARLPEAYDGVLAQAPGFHLPRAAAANMANTRHWAQVSPVQTTQGQPDLEAAFPLPERQRVARAILARCDALDGLADGLVQDGAACAQAFDLARDVPTCSGPRDGSCLSALQKQVLARVHAPSFTRNGEWVYSGFAFDPGLVQPGWAEWKFRASLGRSRNPVSIGFISSTPPADDLSMASDAARSTAYALAYDLDRDFPKLQARNALYTESALSFMTPPGGLRFEGLRRSGGRMIVVHGTADPIFSSDDTAAWYRQLNQQHGGRAAEFVRYFPVPGMGHSRGGPATDQYDALAALVDWVEQGQAPERIPARVRGPGNPGGANADVPKDWPAPLSRPLCPYPLVARYQGGDAHTADSFTCRP